MMIRVLFLAAVLTASARVAIACGGGYGGGPVLTTQKHPDQPLRAFAQGNLGILRPTYARSYLVVAYRYLAGMPLDRSEQVGAIETWRDRGASQICGAAEAGEAAASPAPIDVWRAARRKLAGEADAKLGEGETRVGSSSYGGTTNCLGDAFLVAARTLAAREKSYGAGASALAAWIARQDAVFANCNAQKKVPVAAPPSGADALARADFAYQSAAAAFYAHDWAAAEKEFRAVAADPASPWRMTARYLVARTMVRRAVLAGDQNDVKVLEAAYQELQQILADKAFAPIHEAARHYLPVVHAKINRDEVASDLSVELGKGKLGKEFGATLTSYAYLHGYETEEQPAASASDADRLDFWITTLRRADFSAAAQLYRKTKSPVWLAAALMTATSERDPELTRLLAAAAAIDRKSPAYPTVRYHRLRLLLALKQDPQGTATELATVRRSLRPEDGPSAMNSFQELAFRSARSLDELLAEGIGAPAGEEDEDAVVVPGNREERRGLFPEAAELVTLELPTSRLVEAARAEKTPAALRPTLLATTYVRAGVLGDRAAAAAIAPLLKTQMPALAPYVDRIESAPSEPLRRFELLYLLAQASQLSYRPPAWGLLASDPKGLVTSSAISDSWTCEVPAPPKEKVPPRVGFLTAAERTTARQEWQQLWKLGAGATYLNAALADVAAQVPPDDRVAEALHIAVGTSRSGCKDSHTTAAAKRAFTVLKKRFPKSTWARQTRHYY